MDVVNLLLGTYLSSDIVKIFGRIFCYHTQTVIHQQ